MKRGRAIDLRSVDVGFLEDERSDGRLVAFHRRVGDIAASGSKRKTGDEKEQPCGKTGEDVARHVVDLPDWCFSRFRKR